MSHSNVIQVYILEEDETFRKFLVNTIKEIHPDTYELDTLQDVLEKAESRKADIIILNIDSFIDEMVEIVERIRSNNSIVQIVITSHGNNRDEILLALNAGADCYLPGDSPPGTIKKAIGKRTESVIRRKRFHATADLLEQYRDAVDQSNLVSRTDTKGIITYVNDRFVSLSGYSRWELLGSPHNIVRHPHMSPDVFRDMWDTIKQGRVWNGIVKNRKKTGEAYSVDATILPIFNTEGKIVEYLAVRHDVTELESYREILEKRLADTSQGLKEKVLRLLEYEKAIDSANAFSKISRNGKITYVNDTFCNLTGCDSSKLIGTGFFRLMHPSCYFAKKAEIRKSLSSKKIWHGDFRFRFPNGSICYTKTILVPILDANGSVIEIMGIHHDVNEVMHLNSEIEETQREVLFRMGELAETRSKETGNHVRRVANYSRLLAIESDLGETVADLLHMAVPMHDIGKVGIPDAILNKPGKLTPEEFERMKEHTRLGYEMLRTSERPLLHAASIVAQQHHEKWDGSGYPNGLAGEEIHIFGRITAVADVFDALGTERVYKPAWPIDKIIDYFIEQRGKHFDPDLVDIFLRKKSEFLKIRESLEDHSREVT